MSMQISINKQQLNEAFNSNATFSDLTQTILARDEYSNLVLSHFEIDGKVISADDENELMGHRLGEYSSINLAMKTNVALAFEALDSCNQYIDTVIEQIRGLVASYNENQFDQANQQFVNVIEITDLYIQLMARIQKTIREHLGDKWSKPSDLQTLEFHLLSILKALIPAKEKNDIIMLCDLLEYELVDNLKQWKIKALPSLRAMRQLCESSANNN